MDRTTEIVAPAVAYLVAPGDDEPRTARLHLEHLRPLSRVGAAQALGLARFLDRSGITRVITSPHLGCRQTVEPLAMRRSIEVEDVEFLRSTGDASWTYDLMHATSPVVVCAPMVVVRSIGRHIEASGYGRVDPISSADTPLMWVVRRRLAVGVMVPQLAV